MSQKRKGVLLVIPVLVLVLVLVVSSVGMAAAGGNGKGNGKGSDGGNGKGGVNAAAVAQATPTTSGDAQDKSNNGKGVIHQIYTAADGTVYNAIYHCNTGKLTVTGAIYPKSGPLKFYPDCGPEE